ncbi:ABC transporter permease subunit [Aeromonas phage vB_ AhaP_PT2]|uniref:ABC transporter permease subunit n=1 Tax=Aeromonas phage vB_ AhaP_PT2 TaxID=2924715 RepID=A0AC61TT45_9CAUD|nr:ABC transporter permease subunit [Aeromonas phage vB_ AhaP_PT2]
MSKRSDPQNLRYFARRKDTGMAGVWYTHCANKDQKHNIFTVLRTIAKTQRNDLYKGEVPSVITEPFDVFFLEKHFVHVVKSFVKVNEVSVTSDLLVKLLKEEGHILHRMP